MIHYGCARSLQREEDLRVGFGNLLQTPVCFNIYTVMNTSPIWFCKELSEEMEEKEEMHFVLLGMGCYFPICSGAPSGWGDESAKVRCSQDWRALWRTTRQAQPGPEGPLEDQAPGATGTGRPSGGPRVLVLGRESRGRSGEWPPESLPAPQHLLHPLLPEFSLHS